MTTKATDIASAATDPWADIAAMALNNKRNPNPIPIPIPNAASVSKKMPFRSSSSSQTPSSQLLITHTHTKDWWSFASDFVLIGGCLCALAYMFKQLMNHQTPDSEKKKLIAENIKKQILLRMSKCGRTISLFNTNTYEDHLLHMIVLPEQIEVQFNDIGGLNTVKRDLTETVLVPLIYPQLTSTSKLCAPPLGVLFYGPSGTGKTMMAKAIARETSATFFNVDMSRLMSKWYGDSQKFISALFSLARKMAPSIIWIDEIDALFAHRSNNDHSADVYNKALFLSLWDGLANDIYNTSQSAQQQQQQQQHQQQSPRGIEEGHIHSMSPRRIHHQSAQVLILGATNRPQEVDEAFLRRMSRQYEFAIPNEKTRRLILSILLKTENIHPDVNLSTIAQKTEQYSGSDLKEVCKYAATLPLREYVRRRSQAAPTKNILNDESQILLHNNNGNSTRGGGGGGNGDHSTKNGLVANASEDQSGNGWLSTMFGNPSKLEVDVDRNSSAVNLAEIEDNHFYPTPGNSNETADAVQQKPNGGGNGNANNIRTDVFRNLFHSDSTYHLRTIVMNDFEIALEHIQSTSKAHNLHQQRYGAKNNRNNKSQMSSLFNMFSNNPFGIQPEPQTLGNNNNNRNTTAKKTQAANKNNNNNSNNNSNSNSNREQDNIDNEVEEDTNHETSIMDVE